MEPHERTLRAGPPTFAPVHLLAGERDEDRPDETRALCLSGGGYRAMLFHAGALLRLNEAGLLPALDRISAVSGGAIVAALLGWRWDRLEFGPERIARNLRSVVVDPLRRLAATTIDADAILIGLASPGTVNDRLADHYGRHLFGATPPGIGAASAPGPTLQDLPERPRIVLNATNLQSGVLWRFSRREMADYRVGTVPAPRVGLAQAVAASSAFPPFLSPQLLHVDPDDYSPDTQAFGETADLTSHRYREQIVFSDGGVYDNLGLETAWKRCRTLLVSDGGGTLQAQPDVPVDWARRQMVRVTHVIDNQVRTLRKRQLIEGFRAGVRDGAYWSLRSAPEHFPVGDPLLPRPDRIATARAVPTRLAALPAETQTALLDWGYAACDLGLRGHVLPGAPRPERLPYGD